MKDQEASENTDVAKKQIRTWRQPSFRGKQLQGKEYGTAVHAVMQYIDYQACGDLAGVEQEIRRLVDQRYITPEQGKMANGETIAAFFASDLGQRLRSNVEVVREFKFTILEDGGEYDPALHGEQVMLQGVVDCAIVEADGITILDFKTDHVTQDSLQLAADRYRPQVQVYAQALAKIYQKPVKASLLYFFRLGQFVQL